jgi:hypothetical protein
MGKYNHSIPGMDEVRDACLQMASDAKVQATYIVTAPLSLSADTVHFSRSFSTAVELWKVEQGRCLSIVFNWAVGDESGSGIARFDRHKDPTVQQCLVEGTVRNMIVREIADRLFERIPRFDELEVYSAIG